MSALANLNDFLNLRLFEMNEIYIELFTHYRRCWFYFENDISGETSIKSYFIECDKFFHLLVTRSHYENGPSYTLNWISQAAKSLKTVIKILQDLHRKRNGWAEIKNLEAVASRLNYIQNAVLTWHP